MPDHPCCVGNAVPLPSASGIVSGSDGPGLSLQLGLRKLDLCDLNDNERELILGKNMERMLHTSLTGGKP